jgi:hypothetical protein
VARRQCSYCEEVAKSSLSLADQDWIAIVLNIGSGKNHKRFSGRACPKHKEKLLQKATEFYMMKG